MPFVFDQETGKYSYRGRGVSADPAPVAPGVRSATVIRRVDDVSYDISKQIWKVTLHCGHKLEVDAAHHSMKVVARWCPSCEWAAKGELG